MKRAGPIIAGVVSLLLALVAFMLLVRPKMQEVGEREEQLEAAEDEQIVLEAELRRLQDLQAQAPELRRRLAVLRKEVPPVADLPGLIVQLQQIADLSDAEFFSVAPGQPIPTPEGDAAVIPAEVQIIGGFFSVDEFLFRLETLPRAAKVVSVTVASGAGGEGEGDEAPVTDVLNVALSVEFYTIDAQAGPGAPVDAAPEEAAPEPPSPEESPSPGATPTPSPT